MRNVNENLPVPSPVDELGERNESGSLQNAENCLREIGNCLTTVDRIADSIGRSAVAWKQIDKEMQEMSIHFETFAKGIDADLEKYKSRMPLIEKQLDAVNANMSKILDYVMAMDTTTEQQMDMKMRWMDKLDLFLNTMSQTMIKMM